MALLKKTFNTEAQSARRKKNAGLERDFSVNYHDFLCVLRVLYIKREHFNKKRIANRRIRV